MCPVDLDGDFPQWKKESHRANPKIVVAIYFDSL
jgi:hypothetical protein